MYVSYFTQIAILAGLYFFTGKFGLTFDAASGFATLVWPPTGIALSALLLFGYKLWPGIAIGAFLVNFLTGAPFLAALGISIGNTLEAIFGAYLLKKARFQKSLERLRDVIFLIVLAACISTLISASIGVTSLFFAGIVSFSTIAPTWISWWIGDMLGNLIIAPVFLVWSNRPRAKLTSAQAVWAVFFGIVLIFVNSVVFTSTFKIEGYPILPLLYIVFPLLIWVSFIFGQRGTTLALFALAFIAISNTVQSLGPFAGQKLSRSLFILQSFLGITSVTFLTLASVVSERKLLERRKNEFITVASHELKTPITSIKSYIQILQKHLQNPTKKQIASSLYFLSQVNDQIDKLTIIINDLLDISKIQAGKLELRKKRFDFDFFVKNIVVNFQHSTDSHIITIEGETKKKIFGDEYRLGQLLTNLLSNAIKYSPKKDHIIVKTKSYKNVILVSVQDFGIGISREDQRNIFEPFFQVRGKKEYRIAGLGMGLHIASEIAKRHGGTLWVESAVRKGSTFYFTLPLNSSSQKLYRSYT